MTPGQASNGLDVLVIGGGQAGLAMGHHLAQRELRFQIVDSGPEIGAAWLSRCCVMLLRRWRPRRWLPVSPSCWA